MCATLFYKTDYHDENSERERENKFWAWANQSEELGNSVSWKSTGLKAVHFGWLVARICPFARKFSLSAPVSPFIKEGIADTQWAFFFNLKSVVAIWSKQCAPKSHWNQSEIMHGSLHKSHWLQWALSLHFSGLHSMIKRGGENYSPLLQLPPLSCTDRSICIPLPVFPKLSFYRNVAFSRDNVKPLKGCSGLFQTAGFQLHVWARKPPCT